MKRQTCLMGILGGAAALVLCFQIDGQAGYLAEESFRQTESSVLVEVQEPQMTDSFARLPVSYDLRAEKTEVQAPLAVQLNEVMALELQLETEQDAADRAKTQTRYEELLIQTVTGGYDREQGTKNRYVRENGSVLDQQMADYYRDFIDANGHSRTAEVLEKYLQVLEENNLIVSGPVLDFYEELPELVQKWSRMEKGDARYWLWKLGLLSFFEK